MSYPSCHCPEFKDCTFRIYDLKMKIPICNYISATTGVQASRLQYFINRACKYIKTEEGRLASIRKVAHRNSLDFLKSAQIGDTVYCFKGSPYELEVTLLEKPSDLKVSGRCKIQRESGKVCSVHIHQLRTFSKGNYTADYFVGGVRSKKRAQDLEYYAKYYGFRAELKKREEGYLLKIFGDSQQEVDEFINLFVEENLELVF